MAETQYIDLFTEHRKTIDEKSSAVLNRQRDKAFDVFSKVGFPNSPQEDYLYSDIKEKFEPDYGLNIRQLVPNVNPYIAFKCNVPNLSTNLFFMLNDSLYDKSLPAMNFPDGVFAGSLKTFAENHPDICEKYYGQVANVENNGLVAFNTMFAQDGFVLYIPDNVIVEQPVQLINILISNADFLVNRRLLLIVGKNAQCKVLVCDHAVDSSSFLATQVTEIFAEENAHVDFYELEENSNKVTRLASTFVHQEGNANVLVNNITLNCGFTRNNYYMKLAGEHAEGHACGAVVADKKQHVDNFVFVDHAKPNCQSNQLFKYVLQDDAVGAFCGRILVEKDAQKTQAFQTNNNLCSSPTARMYSKPQLEIYADDVKCSHGLTTGQLDEDALFYMRARGIAEADARLMLMQAFTSGVLDLIRLNVLKERLYDLIEKRFKGESARCGDCLICK